MEYCGCCGREKPGPDPLWCADCVGHVLGREIRDFWERTYFAQHGRECPYQVVVTG